MRKFHEHLWFISTILTYRLASHLAFHSGKGKEIEEKNRKGKDPESLQRKLQIQGKIPCKHGHNKEQKWSGPMRNRRY